MNENETANGNGIETDSKKFDPEDTAAILKEKLYTIKEVAKMIGVAKKTVYIWKDEGRLKTVRIAGSVIRVTATELADFMSGRDTDRKPVKRKPAGTATATANTNGNGNTNPTTDTTPTATASAHADTDAQQPAEIETGAAPDTTDADEGTDEAEAWNEPDTEDGDSEQDRERIADELRMFYAAHQ